MVHNCSNLQIHIVIYEVTCSRYSSYSLCTYIAGYLKLTKIFVTPMQFLDHLLLAHSALKCNLSVIDTTSFGVMSSLRDGFYCYAPVEIAELVRYREITYIYCA